MHHKGPGLLPAASTACADLHSFIFFTLEPKCLLGPGVWKELWGKHNDSPQSPPGPQPEVLDSWLVAGGSRHRGLGLDSGTSACLSEPQKPRWASPRGL